MQRDDNFSHCLNHLILITYLFFFVLVTLQLGCSTHFLKPLFNTIRVPVIFFHQTFFAWCWQNLFFLNSLMQFLLVDVEYFYLFAFYLSLSAIVLIHFRFKVSVVSSQIPAQKSSNFSIFGIFFLLCFGILENILSFLF